MLHIKLFPAEYGDCIIIVNKRKKEERRSEVH